MPDEKSFERWAKRAAEERAPEPDVLPAVMDRIHSVRPQADLGPGALPWVVSGAMAAAAAVCAVVGLSAWASFSSPLGPWLQSFSEWGML